ncbi:hypothetical protein BDZ91DRAFT_799626 [Kalaharituber pfeilii]|nr:hypothetical protein BDZ91DRAFT_799626 [Kalaharituber pfeilii]
MQHNLVAIIELVQELVVQYTAIYGFTLLSSSIAASTTAKKITHHGYGFECAGLILGIFPLVVEGLKLYAEGFRTIQGARGYCNKLNQYSLDLSIEETKFKNTWTRTIELALAQSSSLKQQPSKLNLAAFMTQEQTVNTGIDLDTLLALALPNCDPQARSTIEKTMTDLYRTLEQVKEDFLIEKESIPDKRSLKK